MSVSLLSLGLVACDAGETDPETISSPEESTLEDQQEPESEESAEEDQKEAVPAGADSDSVEMDSEGDETGTAEAEEDAAPLPERGEVEDLGEFLEGFEVDGFAVDENGWHQMREDQPGRADEAYVGNLISDAGDAVIFGLDRFDDVAELVTEFGYLRESAESFVDGEFVEEADLPVDDLKGEYYLFASEAGSYQLTTVMPDDGVFLNIVGQSQDHVDAVFADFLEAWGF